MASETPIPESATPSTPASTPDKPVKTAGTPAPASTPKSVAPVKVSAAAALKPTAAAKPAAETTPAKATTKDAATPATKPLAVLITPAPQVAAAKPATTSAAQATAAQGAPSASSEAVKAEAPKENAPHVLRSFELPSAVYSPQLLEAVIYDIQYYLDWYRQNQIRKKVGASPKDEPNHTTETVLVIEAWLAGKPATLEALEALLGHLHELKLPEVHITLAALPNRTQRENLVTWFRNNTKTALLVSFVADRNLGGGIVVRTPNHLFDFSWKQEFLASRDKLAGILKRV